MKALAIINQIQDANKTQGQFDMVMAAIAYDFTLSIIFMNEGCHQVTKNKAWRCLSLYDVKDVYYYHKNESIIEDSLFVIKSITQSKLKKLIHDADIVL